MRKLVLLLSVLMCSVWAADVPTQLQVAGKTCHLSASAWRDFMPQVGGDGSGSPLMVSLALLDEKQAAASGITFDQAVVTCEGKQWTAVPDPGGTLRGGPKWAVGSNLMVKAHCKHGWIRLAKPTAINRTD